MRLIVPAKLRLRIRPGHTHWGGTISDQRARARGLHPGGEKFLRLRIGVAEVKETFGIANVLPDGRFHTTFKFSPGNGSCPILVLRL